MRVAVVSPFVDRRHGTERALTELLDRLADVYSCEIHLFSQSVQDLQIVPASSSRKQNVSDRGIVWHKVPSIPGPHLFQFLAWFYLNRLSRWRYAASRKISFDLVLSPGVNCPDADVILVHVLFHRLQELSGAAPPPSLAPASSSALSGLLRNLHRRFYYSTLTRFERRIYANPNVHLAAVSRRTAALLSQYFHRTDVHVIPNGVDTSQFSPALRISSRRGSRSRYKLADDQVVLLLIGNDWNNKGLPTLLQAIAKLRNSSLRLIIVGSDSPDPFQKAASDLGVLQQCFWQEPVTNVLELYAVADIYVSPSREDSFGLPVAEAMACGLPVITSIFAGVSDVVSHGQTGFILQDPHDVDSLAHFIAQFSTDAALRSRIGANAAQAVHNWTWDKNAAAVWQLLQKAFDSKERT